MTSSNETFFALRALCVGNSPVNSPYKPVKWSFDVFLWSAPEKNGWINNRNAGDFRRRDAHYDVTVMEGHGAGGGSGLRQGHLFNALLFSSVALTSHALDQRSLETVGRHLPMATIAAISNTTYSDAFPWIKNSVFWFKISLKFCS